MIETRTIQPGGVRHRRGRVVSRASVATMAALLLAAAACDIGADTSTGDARTETAGHEPMPPTLEGIFANVGGWISYSDWPGHGGPSGIWAVDPTRPNDPEARIQLSERPGEPLAWSSDGSKLLIWLRRQELVGTPGCPACRGPDWTGLFVLNSDGTQTRLVPDGPAPLHLSRRLVLARRIGGRLRDFPRWHLHGGC